MAKKTNKTAAAPVIVPEDDEALPVTQDATAERMAEFLEEFGGKEYKVRVEQFNVADKAWDYLDAFQLDGFDAFATCKAMGPGRYRLTFLNEHGKYVQGGQPQIRIGGRAAAAAAAPAPTPAAPVEQDPLKHPMVMMVMQLMEKSNSQTMEMLKAIATRPEPAKSSSAEVLELMGHVKKMQPDDPMKKISETLMLKLIERGLDGGGNGGEGGGWASELRELLGAAKDIGVLNARRLPPAGAPADPQPALPPPPVKVHLPGSPEHVATPPPAPKEAAPVNNPIVEGLRPYVQILLQRAENGVGVQETASYVLDELDNAVCPLIRKHHVMAKFASNDSIIENILGRASSADELEAMFQAVPELAAHRSWCVQVISATIALFNEPAPQN